jgi:trigger factor
VAELQVKTTVSDLPDSRARVEVEIGPREVASALDAAARSLGRNLRLPGFRKGKIPPSVLIQRLGREAVLEEAVQDRLARWYTQAIGESAIAAVGDPDISLGALPGDGEPYRFTFEIGVRPVAKLGEWRGLEVGRREPAVQEGDVDRQLEEARERLARLEPVERAAGRGDFVVIDYNGEIEGESIEGGEGRGQLLEIGSGRLVPGLEEGIIGARAGEQRTIEVTFPRDYERSELAGRQGSFTVTVNEVREKILPELDDDFASDAAGLDTLEELREEIRAGLLASDERAIEREFRGAVLDAAAAASKVSIPEPLVDARNRETWERTVHQLGHRGLSKEMFLRIAGKTEDEVLAEARPDAEQSLRREAVLAAIIETEGIEPTDEELIDAIVERLAPEQRPTSDGERAKLLERLRKAGSLNELREDVAADRAFDQLVAAAKPIDAGRAAAREKLWTPS